VAARRLFLRNKSSICASSTRPRPALQSGASKRKYLRALMSEFRLKICLFTSIQVFCLCFLRTLKIIEKRFIFDVPFLSIQVLNVEKVKNLFFKLERMLYCFILFLN
jgi:hypothetical protein